MTIRADGFKTYSVSHSLENSLLFKVLNIPCSLFLNQYSRKFVAKESAPV